MTKGLSIHVGLNHVDPSSYGGWDGELNACHQDARDMRALAKSLGYDTKLMLDDQATMSSVLSAITAAGKKLASGDVLLVTYSGHGGSVPDVNGDEPDGNDETWALWDGMVLDDELAAQWAKLAAGVRVIFVSDSCHSETMARALRAGVRSTEARELTASMAQAPRRTRLAPVSACAAYFAKNVSSLRRRSKAAGSEARSRANTKASVVTIAGCKDDELSSDGTINGWFTENLLAAWDAGSFSGTHRELWQAVTDRMSGGDQHPGWDRFGAKNAALDAQQAFAIETTGKPAVRMPQAITNGAGAGCRLVVDLPAGSEGLSEEALRELLYGEVSDAMLVAALGARRAARTMRSGIVTSGGLPRGNGSTVARGVEVTCSAGSDGKVECHATWKS